MSNDQPTWVWEVRWSNPHRPRPEDVAFARSTKQGLKMVRA